MGMGPVGEDDQIPLANGITDETGARVARMAECRFAAKSALDPRVAGTDVKSTGAAMRLLHGQECHVFGAKNALALPETLIQEHAAVEGQVTGGGE